MCNLYKKNFIEKIRKKIRKKETKKHETYKNNQDN